MASSEIVERRRGYSSSKSIVPYVFQALWECEFVRECGTCIVLSIVTPKKCIFPYAFKPFCLAE